MMKSTLFVLGACAGATVVLLSKAAKPLGAYAFAGGMIAFEAACDAAENSRDLLSEAAERIRRSSKS